MFRRLHDDKTILERFFQIRYPIQFYDILFALLVMAEIGKIRDARCQEALGLLRAKQRPDGGFPIEMRTARTARRIVTGGTFADWGPAGKRCTNPLVTVDALWILKRAGLAVE